jgi:hypothetical protein
MRVRRNLVRTISLIVWNWVFRTALFWAIVSVVAFAFGRNVVPIDFPTIAGHIWAAVGATVQIGPEGEAAVRALIDPGFAISLAWSIFAIALGLLAAVFVTQTVWILLSLWVLGGAFRRYRNQRDFARAYEDRIYPRLATHPLIGHAWREFDETLVKRDAGSGVPIMNTVRPQSFINMSLAREKLFGLKMIGSIPGYFVGIGLLFTFVGIVLALAQAGKATTSDTQEMLIAMSGLLHVASFKFSTSIAGLGSSILLAFCFKTLTILIETAFSRFCELAEQNLSYTAPQSLAAEMNAAIKEQRDELKAINSEQFFANMGKEIAPHIQTAFATAMAPVTTSLDHAVQQIGKSSQAGATDLLERFTKEMHAGAGTELQALGSGLREMQTTLVGIQRGLQGTGEDFSRRISEAAENLNRLVGEAGNRLEAGSEQSRAGLAEVVTALRDTFEKANQKLHADLGSAAAGASAKVEGAMSQIMVGLQGTGEDFSRRMSEAAENLNRLVGEAGNRLEAGSEQSRAGLAEVVTALRDTFERANQKLDADLGSAAAGASAKVEGAMNQIMVGLETQLGGFMARLEAEISRFAAALNSAEGALAGQANAIGEATGQTRVAADAFAQTAQRVQTAAAPLIESSQRIQAATEQMSASVAAVATTMNSSQAASTELSQALVGHIQNLSTMWQGYKQQFDKVDEALGRAVSELAKSIETQGESLVKYSIEVDQGMEKAVSHLAPLLEAISENTETFSDEVTRLEKLIQTKAAA